VLGSKDIQNSIDFRHKLQIEFLVSKLLRPGRDRARGKRKIPRQLYAGKSPKLKTAARFDIVAI
jgi:hypothetical protein